ncbi:MAG: hypothetical protein IJH84_28710 [Saccharopolyspora sp.]|uniref:hypothetical protein n=1 Tax=Saccharopolyspora TaxID=1835 RepID=UPI00190DA04A|nr:MULTISPECIES: hypothetical protein [unclassified Saccharopolyspora]MBK0868115.1 hypothetical protein [Saccharopolyspora sp. HNM0986]MBQ6644981.1 hypothetical protein [Saccharopolyspora sp.]
MSTTIRKKTARAATGAMLLAGLVLPLLGCADTDPGVQHYAPSQSRQDIATKVGFIKHDLCFREATTHGTQRCDRYLTQVRNIALSATESTENPPAITGPAQVLQQRVQQLQGQGCLPPSPDTEQRCTASLQAVNKALTDLETALATAPPR